MFHILVSDKLGQPGLERLAQDPTIHFDVKTGLSESELIKEIAQYDALIIRSGTQVTSAVLEAGVRLKVVGRAGIGVDNVDVKAASNRGVIVTNTPQANTIATAEHTMTSLLAACRHTAAAHASLLAGQWERSSYTGIQLYQRTLGLLGFGRISRHVAKRAQAFGMKVIAYDPYVNPEVGDQNGVKLLELDEVLAQADMISLHTSMSPETENIINQENLNKCKDGVIIVNPSRGKLVDEYALADAVKSGKVRAAAVDVYRNEPPAKDHPLIGLENVLHTPHLGASTEEAQRDVALQIVDQVIGALNNKDFRNAVNMPFEVGPDFKKMEPYMVLAAKIGMLQFHMAEGPVQSINIELKGEAVSDMAKPIATGVLKGYLQSVIPESVNYINAPALAHERGIVVSQSKDLTSADYTNLIVIKVNWQGGSRTISGTLFSGEYPRVVRIGDYQLDVDPTGTMLMMVNNDTPGVIGKVGTILAEDGVNIAEWRLGRSQAGDRALAFIQLDSEPSTEAIARLKKVDAIEKLKVIDI